MEEILTPAEVAALLRIHVRTVYKLATEGTIPGNKVGRSWRFSRSDVIAMVSKKQTEFFPPPSKEKVGGPK